ncbi:hypothetical protein BT96DRAFT_1027632 [Gymnopus androsaceus JB14]|uniref:Uncharacterized protein n=1 Tax=Gymnopus androsaceus JB14 TaxID=1447944 RepID=A0A6A4GAL1_9AGAR|nr:hypothetical protein BT96DRAFT_1027632 [Gymnopus androsaceus JB14]
MPMLPSTKLQIQSWLETLHLEAYGKGLNGAQAAWASKKHKGHRILPDSLMDDMVHEFKS